MAFRSIGKGLSAAEKFLCIMNLGQPLSNKTWKNHESAITLVAKAIAEENMGDAGKEVHFNSNVSSNEGEVVSGGVSFDCSWNTRGWQGKGGVVAAISKRTGKIIDVIHKSLSYPQCKKI